MMYRYVERRFGAEETLGGIAASAFQPTGNLPPFLMAQLLFPYTAGEAFVGRLLEVGGGGWTVVDAALRFRPPASTEQVMHPQAYLEVEQPERVSVRGPVERAGGGLGAAARRDAGRVADRPAARARRRDASGEAAAGWGGDRYALLSPRRRARARRPLDLGHAAPTRSEFATALRAWGDEGLPDSTPAGDGRLAHAGRRGRAAPRRRHRDARRSRRTSRARARRRAGRLALRGHAGR